MAIVVKKKLYLESTGSRRLVTGAYWVLILLLGPLFVGVLLLIGVLGSKSRTTDIVIGSGLTIFGALILYAYWAALLPWWSVPIVMVLGLLMGFIVSSLLD